MRFSFILLLACTLNLSHIPIVWGQEDPVPKTADGRFPAQDFLCEAGVGTYASIIMGKRQGGDSMFEIELLLEQEGMKPNIFFSEEVHKEIMLEAFETPRWNTKENKLQAMEEFRNKWTVACLRAPR